MPPLSSVIASPPSDAAAATSRLVEETQKLLEAERAKEETEHKIAQISDILKEFAESESLANAKAQARAKLLTAMSALFPARDTNRGLVLTLPSTRTFQQIGEFGKLLVSTASPMLIEIETYVCERTDNAKNQKAATDAAQALQRELVSRAGIPPEWTVARGFPGVPKGINSGVKRIEQIIISGDFIGGKISGAN